MISFEEYTNGKKNVFYILKELEPRESLKNKYSLEDIYENPSEVLDDLEFLFRHYMISQDLHISKNKDIDNLKEKIKQLEEQLKRGN